VKKGLFFILAAILVAMLVLTACGGEKTPAATTTAPAATTTTAPKTTTPAATTAPKTTAPATTAAAGPKYGGTMRISRFTAEGVSLGDPLNHRGMNSWFMACPALETLLRSDNSGALIPWLATAWKEDVAGKSITLTIRQGVKFHDGTLLNAEAVRWNMQYRMDAKMAAYGSFASVKAIDTNTVQIILKTWDSTVINNLASGPAMIISPDNYLNNGAAYAADHPVGTGPFIFKEWKKNSLVVYEKNPNYWQTGKPYLNRIEWVTIPDMNTKAMSFISGELETIITVDQPQVTTVKNAGFVPVYMPVSGGADGYIFSSATATSPWANLKVRQAANYSINKDEYVKAIFGDLGTAVNQFVPKGNWAWSPDVVGYPYNVDKAKQLLTEAGYPNGFNTILIGSQDATMNKRVLAIQDYFKRVGINAEVKITSDALVREMTTTGVGWEGVILNSLGQSTDVIDTMNRFYKGGGQTFVSMVTPADYVKLITDAVAAPDFATKQKLTQALMKSMVDTYALQLFLDTRLDVAVEQKYVKNSGFLRSINTQMWTPEECWLDK
jgi:peptide/nickel transport system substrate-binding protein